MDSASVVALLHQIEKKSQLIPMKSLADSLQANCDRNYLMGLFDLLTNNTDMIASRLDKIKEYHNV